MIAPAVVAHRVDAVTLAYRVAFYEEQLADFRAAAAAAKVDGRTKIATGKLVGELRHPRSGARDVWHVRNNDFRMMASKNAARTEHQRATNEPGWTVEVVWDAHELARVGDVDEIVRKTRAVVASLGEVFETRLRRIDLCADVAGWAVSEEDRDRILKRSRAKLTMHGAKLSLEDERRMIRANDISSHGRADDARRISGFSIAPGGEFSARFYDKRLQLETKGESWREKKKGEEDRWRAGGWDGKAPITRVEFQIRGGAVKELGLREPTRPHSPAVVRGGRVVRAKEEFPCLGAVLDRVWQRCCEWVRLVDPETDSRLSRCEDDPRWAILRAVTWREGACRKIHARARVRGGATAAQTMGCVLSMLGARDLLDDFRESLCMFGAHDDPSWDEHVLRGHLEEVFERCGRLVCDEIVKRRGRDKAVMHAIQAHVAATARFAACAA